MTDVPLRLEDHRFFHEIGGDLLALLGPMAVERTYEAGDMLVRDGDPADRFVLVFEGKVALEIVLPDRPRVTIQTIGGGEVLGWSWLLPPHQWRLDARAVSRVDLHRDIHGFTILDAPRAILSIDASRFVEVYGWTTQRALIFSNVKYGRSPMVAIRAHPLKPAAVVFAAPGRIDPLAVRLSEVENIPLLTTTLAAPAVLERLEEL